MNAEEIKKHIFKILDSKKGKTTLLYRYKNTILVKIFPKEEYMRDFRNLIIKKSFYKPIDWFICESNDRYKLYFHKTTKKGKIITKSLIVDSIEEATFAKKRIEEENLNYTIKIVKLY